MSLLATEKRPSRADALEAELAGIKAKLDAALYTYEEEFGEIMPIVENQIMEPKPEGAHTPGPWRTTEDAKIFARNKLIAVVGDPDWPPRIDDVENLKFIVRACNAHDELLAACEAALALNDGETDDPAPVAQMLETAIANAKGGAE